MKYFIHGTLVRHAILYHFQQKEIIYKYKPTKIVILSCNDQSIKEVAKMLQDGRVIVFPTDTVYGIGCDPRNEEAVKKIYQIKGRDKIKQLPILAYSKEDIKEIAVFDEKSEKMADKFWPGPLTLILEIKDKKIANALELKDKVAVRVPGHPCIRKLLQECRLVTGTSANFSGQPSFGDSKELAAKFTGYDVLLDGGKIEDSCESTIVEVVGNELKIVRQGKIKPESLV